MQCQHCGNEIQGQEKYCPSCGSLIVLKTVQQTCSSCRASIDSTMKFCANCGKPISPPQDSQHAAEQNTAILPPVPAPYNHAAATAPPVYGMPPTPSVHPVYNESESQQSNKKIWIIVVAIVVVIALIGGGIALWVNYDGQETSNATNAIVESNAGDADTAESSEEKSSEEESADENKTKTCTATPDASVSDVSTNNTTLIAQLRLEDSACKSEQYKESDIRINIKSEDGDVVAAAVFDFAKKPIEFNDGESTISLAFTTQQYWRPATELDNASNMSVVWQTNQNPEGAAAVNVGDARGGANISAEDRERFAQIALSYQLDYDRSDAGRFYSHYTDQLSSKKYGMEINGKAWKYVDIYEHYLKMKLKHTDALLIWASNYSNYTKHGNPADYYVILSGNAFNDTKEAQNWCTANGYTSDDCIPVDLQ